MNNPPAAAHPAIAAESGALGKWWFAGFGALLLLALLLTTTAILTPLNLALSDSQSRILARHFPKHPAQQVVIVGIDEATVGQLQEPLALWHPHLGKFFEAMAIAQPAAVGLDIALPDRSFNWLVPGYDKRLMEGLLAARRQTHIVLGLTLDENGNTRKVYPPFAAVAGEDAFGYVLLPLDEDNVVRRFADRPGQSATLVGQMARKLGVAPSAGRIDYALQPAQTYIPLHQVLGWADKGDADELKRRFSGKPVLLGSVLKYEDRHFQPINLAPWESDNALNVPGVAIHAHILSSIVNHSLVSPLPQGWLIAASVLACLLWFVRARLLWVAALAVGVSMLIYASSAYLLRQGGYVPVAGLIAIALLALFGRWTAESILEMRERRRLRKAFAGYVSPQMMEEILAGRLSGGLGGVAREVCVMFADVRGYTTLSESMSPQAVIAVLNRYFEAVTQAIHAEGGTVNCIMGDGLMAIFGAPKPLDNPSVRAFAAARRMLAALPELNRELAAEGITPLNIGIGLNAGPAIVGHVGSRTRHDYSAIGDTTNVAARLEGLSKEVGYPLVCSQAVAAAIGFPDELVDLGKHAIKGRSPVHVFGWKPAVVTAAPVASAGGQ